MSFVKQRLRRNSNLKTDVARARRIHNFSRNRTRPVESGLDGHRRCQSIQRFSGNKCDIGDQSYRCEASAHVTCYIFAISASNGRHFRKKIEPQWSPSDCSTIQWCKLRTEYSMNCWCSSARTVMLRHSRNWFLVGTGDCDVMPGI